MKTTTLLLGGAIGPFLIAMTLPAERVAFGPADGTRLAKTFTLTSDMTLESMDMLMNGSPNPIDMGMEMSGVNNTVIAVTDEYVSVSGARPAKLQRTFETITVEGEGSTANNMTGEVEMSMEGESELTGANVVFTWDADSEEYEVAFAEDEEGDEELLAELDEDMDLRALLPSGEISVDDEWEIDPDALKALLLPGGNLHLDIEMDGDDAGMGGPGGGMDGNYGEMMGDADGTFTGKLTGTKEVDGRKVAVITLTVEVDSSNDMTEMMREQMAEMELPPEAASMEIESVDVELSLEGEGQLLWDIEGGHFHSLELNLEVSSTMDNVMAMSMQGTEMAMESTMEFTATQTVLATVERL